MLVLRTGSKVPFPEKLSEEYMVTENRIIANVSADKIKDVMEHFILMHEEPFFFTLELPFRQEENENGLRVVEKTHNDVYSIDGCTKEDAQTILLLVGDLMINDGLCAFGFGCQHTMDEIMFGKYNVTTIYSESIEQYVDFMEEHEIPKTSHVTTAWDTFSREHPGISERIETDGEDVFSIPVTFLDWGIYKAEQWEA